MPELLVHIRAINPRTRTLTAARDRCSLTWKGCQKNGNADRAHGVAARLNGDAGSRDGDGGGRYGVAGAPQGNAAGKIQSSADGMETLSPSTEVSAEGTETPAVGTESLPAARKRCRKNRNADRSHGVAGGENGNVGGAHGNAGGLHGNADGPHGVADNPHGDAVSPHGVAVALNRRAGSRAEAPAEYTQCAPKRTVEPAASHHCSLGESAGETGLAESGAHTSGHATGTTRTQSALSGGQAFTTGGIGTGRRMESTAIAGVDRAGLANCFT